MDLFCLKSDHGLIDMGCRTDDCQAESSGQLFRKSSIWRLERGVLIYGVLRKCNRLTWRSLDR